MSDESKFNELLCCPVCGGDAKIGGDFGMHIIKCANYIDCEDSPTVIGGSVMSAKIKWNDLFRAT